MAVGDIYFVAIRQQLHGQLVINTLHYRETATGTNPPVNLTTTVQAQLVPALKGIQSQELTHVDTLVQKIFPLPPNVAHISTAAAGPGVVAQEALPTSMAVVWTKRTAFAGRRFRGRIYVTGIPITSELDSQLAPGQLAGWATAANAFQVALADGGSAFEPVLWHRATSTFTPITDVAVRPIMRNQRRRQIGKGV